MGYLKGTVYRVLQFKIGIILSPMMSFFALQPILISIQKSNNMVLVLDRFVLVHNNYFLISLLEFEYDSKAFKNVKEKHCIISMFCPVRRIIK